MTSPEFEKPSIDLPSSYSVIVPISMAKDIRFQWWESFGEKELNELVGEVLDSNVDLAIARKRAQAANAIVRQNSGSYFASSNLDWETATNGQNQYQTGFSIFRDFFGGKRWAEALAVAESNTANYSEKGVQLVQVSRVSVAFIELRYYQKRLLLHQEGLKIRERILQDVIARKGENEATLLDVIQAQISVAEARTEIPLANTNIARQRNYISTLLGKPAGGEVPELPYSGRQPEPKFKVKIGIPANLIRNRPEIRQAEFQYAAAVSQVSATQASFYPSLRLSGNIVALGPGSQWGSAGISVGLNIPVFSRNAIRAKMDEKVARANEAYLQWRAVVLSAIEEVENAMSEFSSASRISTYLRQEVELNVASVNMLQDLAGESTTQLDVYNSELALIGARTRLSTNLRDVSVSFVKLNTALGISGDPAP